MDVCTDHQQLFVVLREIISDLNFILLAFYREYRALKRLRDQVAPTSSTPAYTIKTKIHKQIDHLNDLISFNDETCIANLRMSRNAFGRLCYLLENVGGLCRTKNVQITEQVAIFLSILAHHKKNVVVKHDFKRSGYTISAHFNNVLAAFLRLHTLFLVKPQPIEEHCTNDRWKWFQMPYDPLEAEIPEVDDQISDDNDVAFIDQVEPSQQWICYYKLCMDKMNRMRGGIGNGSASKNCRRCWTVEEEKALANAMKDLVVRGYKADNGFKSGYQNLLEQAMMQAFPGTTLKVEPHINSRITVWRKNYASISTMLTRSGFGFNSTTNMITVESQEVWDNYITTDSNARNMRFKTWPLFGDWVDIFGKDRETGEGAEGFADVVQQLFNKDANLEQGKEVEDGGDYSDKRKRKLVDENDGRFIDLRSSFCDKTDNRLEDISRRIGFKHDASISRKAVFEAIGEVTSLDMEAMIMVSLIIPSIWTSSSVSRTMEGKLW
ncbi:hypothetical protein BUALT_Bualt01G0202500 [Buddleja alternifolia]|uniref:Myb/SANT-like domain-containing protein n=1 Tax=Buddleja alternifolia TaxID=168488 RepID=A0AAV6YGD9_9LAMI|nr:hypothetical protein BUALT_Bualt01G0202500 [Buddleja alternifolia]